MPVSNNNCLNIENLTRSNEVKKRRNADEIDDIERRVEELDRELNRGSQATSSSPRFLNQARVSFKQKLRSAMRLTSNFFLRGNKPDNFFDRWLAKNFAIWKKYGQMGGKPTLPGAVRQQFKRAERLFTNDLPHTIGRKAIDQTIRDNWDKMRGIKKKYSINDADFNELSVLSVELSYSRYAKHHYNVGTKGFEFIRHRFERFKTFMDDLGIATQDQENILQMGKQVADSYHQTLRIAQDFGINANQLENMEFFPRQFTEDIQRRFTWENIDKGNKDATTKEARIRFSDESEMSLGEAFLKSRNTNNYVVEDEVVLGAMLDKRGFWDSDEIKARDDINTVNDLLDPDNGLVMNRALFDNLSEEELNALVEQGIVSKVPMTSKEMKNWLSEKFPLPFDDLNTIIQTDWKKAFDGYRDQLKKMSGKSGMVWTMIANAVGADGNKMPWGITKQDLLKDAQKPVDQQEFQNFKKLFPESPGDKDALLTEDLMQTFVRSQADKAGEIPQAYVHPTAAELFDGMMDIAQNPGKLGVLGDAVRTFNTTFKRMATLSPSFLTQQFLSPLIQTHTAGGNIVDYTSNMVKAFGLQGRLKKGDTEFEAIEKVFDNKRKVFKGLNGENVTEAELYKQAKRIGFVNNYVPGLGGTAGSKNTWSVSPGNLKGQIKRGLADWQQLGAMENANQATKVGRQLTVAGLDATSLVKNLTLDPISQSLMVATSELENVGRFTTIKSLTRQGDGKAQLNDLVQQAGKIGTTGRNMQYNSLEGAVEHAQNYFFMMDDQGKLDAKARDFVVPFWSFISRNPPAQLRNTIRKPIQHGNYLRLYSATNRKEQVEEELDQPIENLTPDFVQDQRPIYWTHPEDLTEGEETRPFVHYFPTRPFDPVGDAAQSFANASDWLLQKAELMPKPHERNEDIVKTEDDSKFLDSETNKLLDSYLTNSYGVYSGAAGALLNREIGQGRESLAPDPTKRTANNFLGVGFVPPQLKWLVSESVPLVERLHKSNPGGIFGTRGAVKIGDDGESVEVVEAERSIFGARRGEFDQERVFSEVANRASHVISSSLFRKDFVDPMFVGADKMGDVRQNVERLKSEIRKSREALRSTTDKQTREEIQKEIESMQLTYLKMQEDLQRLLSWAEENNLRPLDAYRQMKQEKIDLPKMDQSERQQLYEKEINKLMEETSGGN